MAFGIFGIYAAFTAGIFSAWNYYLAAKIENQVGRKEKPESYYFQKLSLARQSYYLMTIVVSIVSVYLWYLIFTHQFHVDYVYRYTSTKLGTGFLLSAFWAGQEGSFLFWALMIALLGLAFMRKAGKFEAYSMLFLNIVQTGFFVLLIKSSPFTLLDGFPVEGAGLNPLLQNPWMVIHPPVLFIGYAALTLPFVISLTALVRRDYGNWVRLSIPWTLFSSVTLGLGIIIGAFWAYEVLGWGGFWGWDPVENSSLIAWLLVLALFHGLLITKKSGALQKTNLSLSVAAFSAVLYATFLTRSGVLADFSVHSFPDLGINAYLTFYIFASLIGGAYMIYSKRKTIPVEEIEFSRISKENILLLTLVTLSACAFFVLIGTSSPLLTALAGKPAQVETDFYNKVNLPIAIIMSVLLGIAPALTWKGENRGLIKALLPSILAAFLSLVIALAFGLDNLLLLLFLTTAVFAFSTNMLIFFKKFKKGWQQNAASIAHIGIGLMFAGIVVAGFFDQTKRVVLTQNTPVEALGYGLTYKGDYRSPDGKNGVNIMIKDQNKVYNATPRFYLNTYSKGMMHEPYIEKSFLNDIYISPLQKIENKNTNSVKRLSLIINEKKVYAGYTISFEGFDMKNFENDNSFRVAARIKFSKDEEDHTISPAVSLIGKKRQSKSAHLHFLPSENGKEASVAIAAINAEKKSVDLLFENFAETINDPVSEPQILIEISDKPFMNVLWFGTILLSLGTLIGFKRRFDELGLNQPGEGVGNE